MSEDLKPIMLTVSTKVSSDSIVFRPIWLTRHWCEFPYPGHKNGCPNSDSCDLFQEDLEDRIKRSSEIHLLWVEFDLDKQEQRMREMYPKWTSKQCRNLLYWQSSVRKRLREKARQKFPGRELIIGAEGGGVDFYLTMRRLGVPLDRMKDLHLVRVIGIILGSGDKKLTGWI